MKRSFSSRLQRGLSLVEMMVGVAIGLIVVAAAALMVSTQLAENRRLLVETQLQQDLRAAVDIVARELRRAGTQPYSAALQTLWYPGTSLVRSNAFANHLALPSSSEVTFEYRPGDSNEEQFGFKLEGNVIKSKLGGAWQELTDPNVVKVTELTITPQFAAEYKLPCPKLCPDGTSDCWPKVQMRELQIVVTVEARPMPEVRRTLAGNVRLRNDYVRFFDPATDQICPP